MASLTICRLNFTSPPPSPTVSKPNQVARVKKEKWIKKQCILGMTCVIIGLESGSGEQIHEAMAENLKLDVATSKEMVASKWSDKRTCSPWKFNELETIVPENLPRPSAHRRWEAVGFSLKVAPPLKLIANKITANCFSL